jgi:hypothetical protein
MSVRLEPSVKPMSLASARAPRGVLEIAAPLELDLGLGVAPAQATVLHGVLVEMLGRAARGRSR